MKDMVPPDKWEFGYPDVPEMNHYKEQLKQSATEMESLVYSNYSVLDIGGKSPEHLLKEMIHLMESECNYTYVHIVICVCVCGCGCTLTLRCTHRT